MDFIIGGVAGAGATIFTNPMDVVKTRMQLQGEMRARSDHARSYRGIAHAVLVITKADGAMALQKGLVPAMWLGFTMSAVRLGLYHVAESHGWTKNSTGQISVQRAAFWSSASGVVSGLVSNPIFVLKTRMQAASHPSIAVGKQHQYRGMVDGFLTMYKTEGMRGFFAGVNATCIRVAIGSAVQLTTFSIVKDWLKLYGVADHSNTTRALIASVVSSFLMIIGEAPLDVANTRLYNQCNKGSVQLYKGLFDCLRKIYKNEGLHGLYKGVGPLYLRIAPHSTLSLVIWDLMNHMFLNRSNNKDI